MIIERKPFLFRSEGDSGGGTAQAGAQTGSGAAQTGGTQVSQQSNNQQNTGGFDPAMAEYYQNIGYQKGKAEANSMWEAKETERIKAQEASEKESIITALNMSDELKERAQNMSLNDLKLMQEFSAGITPTNTETQPDPGGGVAPAQRMHAQTGLENMSDADIIQKSAMKYLEGGN